MDERHAAEVARRLVASRDQDPAFWDWLRPGQPLSRRDANKFFLASILDFQMKADVAWANAKRLAETILGDPEDLWGVITAISFDEWNGRRKQYSLHRFPKGHERVYTIGKRIVSMYGGDVRRIWDGQALDAIMYRFNDLGVGPQISRMIAGALLDTGQVQGKGDVKVDVHVRRVLGRILRGRPYSLEEQAQVIDATRSLWPENPWLLDRPLYMLGRSVCTASSPNCIACFMHEVCAFARRVA